MIKSMCVPVTAENPEPPGPGSAIKTVIGDDGQPVTPEYITGIYSDEEEAAADAYAAERHGPANYIKAVCLIYVAGLRHSGIVVTWEQVLAELKAEVPEMRVRLEAIERMIGD